VATPRNEERQGAQVPWDAQKIEAPVMFATCTGMRRERSARIQAATVSTGRCAISVCRMHMPQRSNATPCKVEDSWVPIDDPLPRRGKGKYGSQRRVKRLPGSLYGPTAARLMFVFATLSKRAPLPAMPVVDSPL